MECDICLNEWNSTIHIPRILLCGHSFCEICIVNLLTKTTDLLFQCPTCKKEQPQLKSLQDVIKLNKNVSLLKLFNKVENHRSIQSNMSFSIIITEPNIKNPIELTTLCKLHKNKANYYDNNNKQSYLCEMCIKEKKVKSYSSLPNLVHENQQKINSIYTKAKLIKCETNRLIQFLNTYLKDFELLNMSKIDEVFEYFNKLISYNYTSAKTLFLQCKKEQSNQIEKKLKELALLLNEISKYESSIEALIKSDNKVFSIDNQIQLNAIYNKIHNFLNYDNELNVFQMKIEINEEIKEQIFDLIQSSYNIDVDYMKMKNGELPLVKDLLKKETTWQCQCGEFENKIEAIKCLSCSRYRKLESYDNIIFNPLKITPIEIKELKNRRKSEIKDFQQTLKNDSNNIYALNIQWFLEWKCFVANDYSEKYLPNSSKKISENKNIGILPPSFIRNGNIAVKDSNNQYSVRSEMQYKVDYMKINKELWDFFVLNYEGGPEIIIDTKEKKCIIPQCIDQGIHSTDNSPSPGSELTNVKKFDPNNTMLNDTVTQIAPISKYNFATKLGDFKLNSPIKEDNALIEEEQSLNRSKFKSILDNISINDNNNI